VNIGTHLLALLLLLLVFVVLLLLMLLRHGQRGLLSGHIRLLHERLLGGRRLRVFGFLVCRVVLWRQLVFVLQFCVQKKRVERIA
jgi:hypothetical protein